ncbi:MAG: RluA family pseudouridine synthase [Lachnospiraceae bacterium]|nr:RluA family pseudouridine synthase [Lachnospiraceae bacterium]
MKEIVVTQKEAGQRMDKLLGKVLNHCSKSFLYKMLRKKNIKLNNKKAEGRELLAAGDTIQIFFSDETFEKFSQKETVSLPILPEQFHVLYEDSDVLIFEKWKGVLSQKAQKDDISMNEYFLAYLYEKQRISEETRKTFTPSIANRLDRNTTGLMIGGITLRGSQVMAKALKDRTIGKYYYAYVLGTVKESCHLRGYIKKSEEKNEVRILTEKEAMVAGAVSPIETEYEVIGYNSERSLLKVHLLTGKTHQIRAHLASIGHPIIGDYKYGERKVNEQYKKTERISSQLLHAGILTFPENFPLNGLAGKTITSKLPDAFLRLRERDGF